MNESFGAAIQRLQSLAGHSSEQFETIKGALLAMAENENSERDTHFLGFAGMLYDNIYHRIEQEYGPMHSFRPKIRLAVEQIIAQRAYDLVLHTFQQYWISHNPQWDVQRTPDLDAWPTTKDNDHE